MSSLAQHDQLYQVRCFSYDEAILRLMVKQILLSQGLGMGLGLGMIFTPTVGIISHHFTRRRGLASAIALSGGSCGAVVFPISMLHRAIYSAISYKNIRQCSSGLIQDVNRDLFLALMHFYSNLLQKRTFGDSVRASAYLVLGCLVVGVALMRTRLPTRNASSCNAAPAPNINTRFRDVAYVSGMFGCVLLLFANASTLMVL